MTLKSKIAKLNFVSNVLVDQRIAEFEALNKKNSTEWFSELCFCLLTANSKAKSAIAIQSDLGSKGFIEKSLDGLAATIKKHGHRFHNTKSSYIVQARKFIDIKERLSGLDSFQARQFLVKNVKGLGYKEASHFLRNVGYVDVAIIDRHILRFLHQEGFTSSLPKLITPKRYLEYEEILSGFGVPQNKLDLIIWQKMTGTVLK